MEGAGGEGRESGWGINLSLVALQICYTSLTANHRRNSITFTNFWKLFMRQRAKRWYGGGREGISKE